MPIPTIVKTSSAGTLNLWKFLWKYKFVLLILFSLIPQLIVSINIAKETNNPYYPFVQTGVSIVNADSVLYEDVKLLETDPSQIIGMEKPEIGIYLHIKYFFKCFLVVWAILGLLSLITLPFFIIHSIVNKSDDSKKIRTFIISLIIYFVFILLMNMLIIILKQADGNILYSFDSSLDFFGKAKQVISWILPLHGFWALGKYLINII